MASRDLRFLIGADVSDTGDLQTFAKAMADVQTSAENLDGTDVTVDVKAQGAEQTATELGEVQSIKDHIAESPAVAEIKAMFGDTRAQLQEAESAFDAIDNRVISPEVDDSSLGKLAKAAGTSKGEIVGIGASALAQVPVLDDATSQMVGSLGNVASAAQNIGPAATAASVVASLAMFAIAKGAEQARDRTNEVTEGFKDLSTVSDEALTQQSLQLWADMSARLILDGKSLTTQLHDLAETNIEGARRMLDHADSIGLNAKAQQILADAIAEVEAEAAQGKATQEQYGEATKTSADAATASAAAQQAMGNSLLDAAAKASGPARSQILQYVGSLNEIPPEKMTEIEAAIDRGDVAEAKRLLDEAARDRTATITARVIVSGANIGAQLGAMGLRPTSTAVATASMLANDRAAEFSPPGTFAVQGRAVTASSSPGARAAMSPVVISIPTPNITIQTSVIGNRFDVDRAVTSSLRRFQRLNGSRP